MKGSPLAVAALTAAIASAAVAQDAKPLMRDFIGINAHTVQFPAEQFAPVCRLVRDYHPFDWDVDGKSSNPTKFPLAKEIPWKDASGKFRSWSGPVDWQKVYGEWKAAGFEIDACIQFGAFTPDKWDNLPEDAYRYGKAFAEYFGPSGPNKLVTSVEIGNEPAGNKAFAHEGYKAIFENMARGVRDGDPKMKILTATAEAPEADGKTDGWSMPLPLFRDVPELYDVINVHKYALLQGWPTWERSYPEDRKTKYEEIIQRTINWRDEHAPDKEIWMTEFGFDASTKEPDPAGPMAKWIDSTDQQQAQWIVRSFLMFARMGMDRAYLYWFNDNDTPSFHAASGITRLLEPKPSFWAMRHLYQSLGDYRLARVVEREEEDREVHEYVHGGDPDKIIWVVWSPTGTQREAEATLQLPGTLVKAERMPLTEGDAAEAVAADGARVTVKLAESPLYLWINK